MKRRIRSLFFVVIAVLAVATAWAADSVSTGLFGSTAIGGKDTVSYHDPAVRQSHRVGECQSRYGVKYLGATWRFATQASADKFAANPAAHVPRDNGYCANALSSGEGLARTDGQVWEFFGDQLFLFHGEPGRQRWLQGDAQAFDRGAEKAWQAILQKR
jgi:YHS domain-containing protein